MVSRKWRVLLHFTNITYITFYIITFSSTIYIYYITLHYYILRRHLCILITFYAATSILHYFIAEILPFFFFCNYKTYCIKCLLCLPHVSAKDNAYSCVQYIHLVKFGIGGEITRCSLLTSCYHVIKRDIFFFFFIFIILNDIHTVITRHVYFFYYYYYFSIEHYCLLLVVFMHSLR